MFTWLNLRIRRHGVSTVWRFLHKEGSISPTTGKRVLEAIESLGYSKERKGKKNTELKLVGTVIPDVENPFFSGIVKSLEFFLFRYEFSLLLCNTENNPDLEDDFVKYLGQSGVKGLILIPSKSERRKTELPLDIPVVLLDRTIKGLKTHVVAVNNYQGGRIAVSYLIKKGRKRIAFLGERCDVFGILRVSPVMKKSEIPEGEVIEDLFSGSLSEREVAQEYFPVRPVGKGYIP